MKSGDGARDRARASTRDRNQPSSRDRIRLDIIHRGQRCRLRVDVDCDHPC